MRSGRTKANILKIIAILMAASFVMFGILLGVKLWESKQADKDNIAYLPSSTIKYEGKEYTFKDNIETFLILGLDKFSGQSDGDSYNNDRQADFVMLLVIDNEADTYKAVHINRDTITDIGVLGVGGEKIDTVKSQLALAHTYGDGGKESCKNVADAVSNLFSGKGIKNYASVTMDAVTALNDRVGGIELELLEDFSDIDPTFKKGEKVKLLGEQALVYVRTRYGLDDSTNNTRMERQRQYLSALMEKTTEYSSKDDTFIVKSIMSISEYTVSNRKPDQLANYFEKLSKYEFEGVVYLKGKNIEGNEFIEFYPDEDALTGLTVELFCEEKK